MSIRNKTNMRIHHNRNHCGDFLNLMNKTKYMIKANLYFYKWLGFINLTRWTYQTESMNYHFVKHSSQHIANDYAPTHWPWNLFLHIRHLIKFWCGVDWSSIWNQSKCVVYIVMIFLKLWLSHGELFQRLNARILSLYVTTNTKWIEHKWIESWIISIESKYLVPV